MHFNRDPLGHQSIQWHSCLQSLALVAVLGASIGLLRVFVDFPVYQYPPFNGLLLPLRIIALVAGAIGIIFCVCMVISRTIRHQSRR